MVGSGGRWLCHSTTLVVQCWAAAGGAIAAAAGLALSLLTSAFSSTRRSMLSSTTACARAATSVTRGPSAPSSLDGRVRKLTITSFAAPHLDELAAVAIGQPVEPSSPPPSPSPLPSQPPPPSPSPSSSVSPTPLLSTSPHASLPLPALSSLPAARRALALSQTTLHDINPAGPPCPTASTPDHAHHIISGPRSSLLSSHHPQPQHEARTSDASGSDALRLYFGCRPVVPRLYRGCEWLYPTTNAVSWL